MKFGLYDTGKAAVSANRVRNLFLYRGEKVTVSHPVRESGGRKIYIEDVYTVVETCGDFVVVTKNGLYNETIHKADLYFGGSNDEEGCRYKVG